MLETATLSGRVPDSFSIVVSILSGGLTADDTVEYRMRPSGG
jgi:hypothetical protein